MNEMRAGLPILTFASEDEFRAWLAGEGAGLAGEGPGSPGAWLRLAKKGAPFATLTKAEAVDAALCHGWIDGQLDKYDAHSWLVRFTRRKARSKWSQVNRDRAEALLAAGRMTPGGLAEIDAARADGRWDAAYAPASSIEVPVDFQAALEAEPLAAAFFATLTGANRYAVLYRIGAVKRPETRARKIRTFVGMLARGETLHG